MERRSFLGRTYNRYSSTVNTGPLTVDALKEALAELAKIKGPICLTGELCFVRSPHNPDNPAFRAMANYLHHGTQK